MQKEFPNQLTYVANVMVNPENLSQVLEIQTYLENRGIYTNLCTQQGKCFGKSEAVFDSTYIPQLRSVGLEMITRKIGGRLVVNSVSYLSQLPNIIGSEDYHCWEEPQGNSVLDIGPDGKVRYCNWINQGQNNTPPGEPIQKLIDKSILWSDFWDRSKTKTSMFCRGCSWSRRDRGVTSMVEFNPDIIVDTNLPNFNPNDINLQNIWVQAQMSVVPQ
jgi:MoaA/NifB/PqqE/SkfB family radical SAM enzyme